MARGAAKPKKEVSMEEALWKSADKLRGSVEPAEYKHVVLSLFFLKFASDKFEAQRKLIAEKYGEKFLDNVAFYTKDNVFFLPEISRWTYIMENAKQDDIALKIDTALYTIEKANPSLKGALPDNYYSRLHIDTAKLASLLDEIDKINTGDTENDIIGRIYEYFLSKFALAEGKGKGEFYTPKCIVNLIAEMIEPYDGILYDPCCGSGGMFVQSMKFVEAHHGNKKKVSIYGQEYTNTTYKLCKMNLAIRGISANLGEMAANTFTNDQHKDLKADYIMANPPFNQKEWRAADELVGDPRWDGYEVPPIIILPRNLFYTTDISVTLWILNKNKKARVVEENGEVKRYRNREREILFMDLRQMGSPYEKKYIELTEEDRAKVTGVYHAWQQEGYEETYQNVPEFCYSASFEEVAEKGFTLVPSRYIEFVNRDEVTNTVLGISINKEFMPSVANVIGTDLSRYKLIQKGMFACNPMHVGRDERLPIALYKDDIPAIVSPAYFMFEIIDPTILDMDYLMMWFRRIEFDRECWFMTDGSVRGGITWDDLCRIRIPVPSIEKQRSIVKAYQTITNRIALKQKINDNLAA